VEHNLDHQETNPNRGTFTKIAGLLLQKSQGQEGEEESEELFQMEGV
jgi:hypothetical protein